MKLIYLITLFIYILFFGGTKGQMISPCVYKQGNYVYNLTKLQPFAPFSVRRTYANEWEYVVGICQLLDISCQGNMGYKAIKRWAGGGTQTCYPIASNNFDDIDMYLTSPGSPVGDIILWYTQGQRLQRFPDKVRTTKIIGICDKTVTGTPQFQFVKESFTHSRIIYEFRVRSSLICPTKFNETDDEPDEPDEPRDPDEPRPLQCWEPFNREYNNFGFRVINGRVFLKGVFQTNESNIDCIVENLPEGFRPENQKVVFSTTLSIGSFVDGEFQVSSYQPAIITIFPNGDIVASAPNVNNDLTKVISLDGFNFKLNEESLESVTLNDDCISVLNSNQFRDLSVSKMDNRIFLNGAFITNNQTLNECVIGFLLPDYRPLTKVFFGTVVRVGIIENSFFVTEEFVPGVIEIEPNGEIRVKLNNVDDRWKMVTFEGLNFDP